MSDGGAIGERLGSDKGAIEERLRSDKEQLILGFIEENGKTTSIQLANYVGVTQGYMRKILIKLAAKGAIEKIGDYRHTHYVMKKS